MAVCPACEGQRNNKAGEVGGQSVRKLAAQVLHQCKEKAGWNFLMTLGKSIPLSGLQLLLFVGWVNATQ